MGSVGDCFDNALGESFVASLECELIDRSTFRSHAAARMAMFRYVEGWYNPNRRHSALGLLSPVNFERRHLSPVIAESANLPTKAGLLHPGLPDTDGSAPQALRAARP